MQPIPSRAASRFMRATNAPTLPATLCARAVAASLPEGSSSPYSMLCSATCRPRGSTPTLEPAASTACLVTSTRACGDAERTTMSAVIILVRLAMRRRSNGLRCHSTSPVSRLNSSPARAGWWKRI